MLEPLPNPLFPEIVGLLRSAWWIALDKTWYEARFRLERRGIRFVNYWVWPESNFRFNSSLMWGSQPYREWAVGPFRYRRYL